MSYELLSYEVVKIRASAPSNSLLLTPYSSLLTPHFSLLTYLTIDIDLSCCK